MCSICQSLEKHLYIKNMVVQRTQIFSISHQIGTENESQNIVEIPLIDKCVPWQMCSKTVSRTGTKPTPSYENCNR
jgi:hypothetical protein